MNGKIERTMDVAIPWADMLRTLTFDKTGNVLRFVLGDNAHCRGSGGELGRHDGRDHSDFRHGRPGEREGDDGLWARMQDAARPVATTVVKRRLTESGYGQFGLLRRRTRAFC